MLLAVDGGATTLRMALVDGPAEAAREPDAEPGSEPTPGPTPEPRSGSRSGPKAQPGKGFGLEGHAAVVRQIEVPGFQWTTGEDPIEQQARRVVEAWDALGRPKPVDAIALGLAGGASDRPSRERLAPLIVERLGAARVLLTGDDVTGHLGVLGGEPGVVVAAGTGVACLAVTAEGGLLNIDGLGYLFGDLGGAFSIGLAGLRAALAADEGRGPATALLPAAIGVAGEPLPRTMRTWYARPGLIADVAAFAPEVTRLAVQGDDVAGEVCRVASRSLAETASAAVSGAFAGQRDVAVSWSGSVLAVSVIRERFVVELTGLCPAARLVEPRGDSMAGAIRLAQGVRVPHLAGVVTAGSEAATP